MTLAHRNPAPAYQCYARDWFVATARLTLEEQGALQRLLAFQWIEGPLPSSPAELARLLAVTEKKFARIWRRLAPLFPARRDGRRANADLERQRAKQLEYRRMQAVKGRAGGLARPSTGQAAAKPKPKPKRSFASASASASASAKTKPSRAAGDSWVAALGSSWARAYGGEPPFGQIGRHCRQLVDAHGLEVVALRWANYLHATEARYASPARFAQTFGAWAVPGGDGRVTEDAARVAFRAAGIPDTWAAPPEGYPNHAALAEAIRVRLGKLAGGT